MVFTRFYLFSSIFSFQELYILCMQELKSAGSHIPVPMGGHTPGLVTRVLHSQPH